MRRPTLWAVVAAAGVGFAACLPQQAPDWLFWGPVAISCAAAFVWALAAPEGD